MEGCHDHSHLHLDTVCEDQLVGSEPPSGVETEWVHAVLVWILKWIDTFSSRSLLVFVDREIVHLGIGEYAVGARR